MTRFMPTLGLTSIAFSLACLAAGPAASQGAVVLERHGAGTVEILSGQNVLIVLNRDPGLALRTGRDPRRIGAVLPLQRADRRTVVRIGPSGTRLSGDLPGFVPRGTNGDDSDKRWTHLRNKEDAYENFLGGAR